jgi:site-specific recombinase XerD
MMSGAAHLVVPFDSSISKVIIMTALRQQMENDMVLRGMAVRTRQSYLEAVWGLAKFYRRSPDAISVEEVQSYLLHLLRERGLSYSTCNLVTNGLRFFYRITLGQSETEFCLPRPKVPQRLPEILSREEIEQLFAVTTNLKHRVLLMTTYSAGLRVSEVARLKVCDMDSQRMTLRVDQGKGAKDRYTLLSKRLLSELRRYWQAYRPREWLFPLRDGRGPIDPRSAQKIYYHAKEKAGIRKRCGIHGLRHASPRTCSKRESISIASSVSWGTDTSRPRCAISTWRNATWRARPRHLIS